VRRQRPVSTSSSAVDGRSRTVSDDHHAPYLRRRRRHSRRSQQTVAVSLHSHSRSHIMHLDISISKKTKLVVHANNGQPEPILRRKRKA